MIRIAGIMLVITSMILVSFTDISTNQFSGLLATGIIVSVIGQGLSQRKKKKKRQAKAKKPSTETRKKVANTKTSIHRSNRLNPDHIILASKIDQLSWKEFEQLAYLYYKSKGCNPQLTKSGADGGIDLIYFSKEENSKVAVQIKHFSNGQVTPKIIRETENAARKNYKIYISEIFTSTRLSLQANIEAENNRMIVKDMYWIERELIPFMQRASRKNA